MAPELLRLWEELAERERQLAVDLLQLEHLHAQVSEEVGLPKFDGQVVAVNGKLVEGASIRMSGPEMTAEEVLRPH